MANLNKVMLIGRCTRDLEFHAFSNGGRVAKIGFAVSNRKKQGDQWVDDPVFLDCECFNGNGNFKLADTLEKLGVGKGSQLFIEGKLKLDSWDDKTSGQKRSKIKVVVENFQLLDSKGERKPRDEHDQGDFTGGGPQSSGYDNDNEPISRGHVGGNGNGPDGAPDDSEIPF